jgi:enolase-phosphatase E1
MIAFSGRHILLDIEGTTSSIAFVADVLFPYARHELEPFLRRRWDEPEVVRARALLAKDVQAAGELELEALCATAYRLMDADAKATGLKELQGLIWREGYDAGRLVSHVYPDVPPTLAEWARRGLDVRIYSSGSVTAQKVYFAHTEAGDLLPLLRGHYDTTTGHKRAAESYRRIAADMQAPSGGVLFLSDVTAELDAAAETGMRTGLVVRSGNAPAPPGHQHPIVTDFEQVQIQ